jgi:hypothetical protein
MSAAGCHNYMQPGLWARGSACRIVTHSGGHSDGNSELLVFHISNHTRLSQTLASCVLEAYSRYAVLALYTGGSNWGAVGLGPT